MPRAPVLELTDRGLYCAAGDFYVDPWRPVERAVVTHGHADHARPLAGHALAAVGNEHILQRRLGGRAFECLPFAEARTIGRARVSLHPAGHILGSAQVRVEVDGEVWVVSGDYKRAPDPTCPPLEVVRCDTFITESTFGLPLYRWPETKDVVDDVIQWHRRCVADQQCAVLFCYALGKSQRLLAELLRAGHDGPYVVHGALAPLIAAYRDAGIALPPTSTVQEAKDGGFLRSALVLAPPSAAGSPWLKRFHPASLALASGWMILRGARRRRALDRGFVLSDHADWPALLDTILGTGAERVLVTHGTQQPMVRFLRERHGLDAAPLATPFAGEGGAEVDDEVAAVVDDDAVALKVEA
ncbi:MAG TPA: ligase-associated DNA damage response exonuclease [Myxococcota bacterium]